jgi:hypothetical protein
MICASACGAEGRIGHHEPVDPDIELARNAEIVHRSAAVEKLSLGVDHFPWFLPVACDL